MYTQVGGTRHFPPGSDHNTAQYHLVIAVRGARGRAYVDRTTKTVYVTIWKRETKMLERLYEVTAASLEWAVTWDEADDVGVLFFEFPEGISIHSEEALRAPAREVFALRFTRDAQSDRFVEYLVPSDVVRRAKKGDHP